MSLKPGDSVLKDVCTINYDRKNVYFVCGYCDISYKQFKHHMKRHFYKDGYWSIYWSYSSKISSIIENHIKENHTDIWNLLSLALLDAEPGCGVQFGLAKTNRPSFERR